MTVLKFCGLNDAAGFDAAVSAGADMLGLVFFPPSPRHLTPGAAAGLSARAPSPAEGGPLRVGLFVDPTDDEIAAVLAALPLDILQLHGHESPGRCAAIRARFGLPVMKALGIAKAEDLEALATYAPVVDRFLLDAKAPPGSPIPGGNALSFDWSLLVGCAVPRPWLLAGGLTAGNVASAIHATRSPGVDVSSGVERARGQKDPALIASFAAAVRKAEPDAA